MERSAVKRRPDRTGTCLALFFFCLYAATCLRGVAWQDSGIYQMRIAYRNLAGFFGAATDHPLYILLAHAFATLSQGVFDIEVPAAANLFSSLCMAFAVKVLFLVAIEATGSRRGAILAALTFGFAHMPWWLATIAESYPLSVLFIGLEALWVVRILKSGATFKKVSAAAFMAGFGFLTHNLSLLSLPVTFVAVTAAGNRRSREKASVGLLRFLGTLWPPLLFFLVWFFSSDISNRINDIDAATPAHALSAILFGDYAREVLGLSTISPKVTAANFAIMAFSFLLPCWPIAAWTLVRRICNAGGPFAAIRRIPLPMWPIIAFLTIHALFLVRYRIADQALFMLPTLFFASVILAFLLKDARTPVHLATTTAICAVAIPFAAYAILQLSPLGDRVVASRARTLPFRDEIRYWTLPWKHDERSAEDFATAAIAAMDNAGDSSLFADSTSAPPIMLRFSASSGKWRLFTPWNDNSRFTAECIDGKPSYAVSPIKGYCPPAALATGKILPLPLGHTK